MVAALSLPGAYPHAPAAVTHIETHISDLFLAGDLVFKVKKPVNLEFCDFSTPEKRQRLTRRELELNGRFSPDVYLGVDEVRWSAGRGYRVVVEGDQLEDGEVVELALRMRRLPSARALDTLAQGARVTPGDARLIARRVAAMHRSAPRAAPGSEYGAPETVRSIVLDNLERARRAAPHIGPEVFADVAAFSSAFLEVNKRLFEARWRSGEIRECHGDLHAGNMFLGSAGRRGWPYLDPVQVIDCIEFNDRLRVIDPIADMAFLAMDLERLGRPDLAEAFSAEYEARTGDPDVRRLVGFYAAYRATVRCMAHGMMAGRGLAGSADAAGAYASLAQRIAGRHRGPALVVMAGTAGSGKSTVASYIARAWGAAHYQTDVVRKRLAGLDDMARSSGEERERLYSPEMSARTYRELERLGAAALVGGGAVVLDGTFVKRDYRKSAVRVGRGSGAKVVIVECGLAEAEQVRRLQERASAGRSVSEGTVDVYLKQRDEWEAVRPDEADAVVRVDTGLGPETWGKTALEGLWRAALAASG
jgi:hypothetical protein